MEYYFGAVKQDKLELCYLAWKAFHDVIFCKAESLCTCVKVSEYRENMEGYALDCKYGSRY